MENSYEKSPELNNATIISVIAYFAFIGLVIAYVLNKPKQERSSFHIRQALGIHLLFIVSGFVMIIPVLGWIVGICGFIAAFILWIMGITEALQAKTNPVPIAGEKFQQWFPVI